MDQEQQIYNACGISASALAEANRKVSEALQNIAANLGELFRAVSDWVRSAAAQLAPLLAETQWSLAYIWAKSAHPEWVAIMNRTKKRRTRKKYADRIRRAYYMEVVARGESAETN